MNNNKLLKFPEIIRPYKTQHAAIFRECYWLIRISHSPGNFYQLRRDTILSLKLPKFEIIFDNQHGQLDRFWLIIVGQPIPIFHYIPYPGIINILLGNKSESFEPDSIIYCSSWSVCRFPLQILFDVHKNIEPTRTLLRSGLLLRSSYEKRDAVTIQKNCHTEIISQKVLIGSVIRKISESLSAQRAY